MNQMQSELEQLLAEIRQCKHCEEHLPMGARPVLTASTSAKILIVGQAPGIRVHNTGIPWNDPSGNRLRDWMNVDKETFYDTSKIAIVPMGFCYPGTGKNGDLPPRKECAQLWHQQLLEKLPNIQLTLLFGTYAQKYFLGKRRQKNLTQTVMNYEEYLPEFLPMVHPSPRNYGWHKKNPWFEIDLVPILREKVIEVLKC
jgi:uracil-DNA glycosylase